MKLGVGILTRNHGPLLSEALESVTREAANFDQIIVLDNASTDGSQELVRDWARDHGSRDKILIISAPYHLNTSGGMRMLLEACKCDYMTILHGDDRLRQGYGLAVRESLAESDLNTVFCVDLVPFRVSSDGREVVSRIRKPAWTRLDQWNILVNASRNPGTMPGSVIPVEASKRASVFTFDQEICCSEDWVLWSRLLESGVHLRRLPRSLVDYRRHSGDSTGNPTRFVADGYARAVRLSECRNVIARAIIAAEVRRTLRISPNAPEIAAGFFSFRDSRALLNSESSLLGEILLRVIEAFTSLTMLRLRPA